MTIAANFVAATCRPRFRRAQLRRQILLSILAGGVVAGLVFIIPRTAGTSWAEVAGSLRQVRPLDLALLTVVWAAGLWCHSWVLTAALPGLSRRRALLLNVCGSAVSDLIPFGAAAGTGINLAMVRSWKFSAARFATFTTISNLWNVLAKLGLPALVLAFALATGTLQSGRLVATAEIALLILVLIVGVATVSIMSERGAAAVGRLADRVISLLLRAVGSTRTPRLAATIPAVRADTAEVIRQGWPQLTAGVTSYLLLQGVLWWMCLDVFNSTLGFNAVLAGFAVERVLSMLPFTPGGAGLAEAGSVAVLVSLGGDPVTVAAAVLLYRGFAFLLEIPVGGLGILSWLWQQRRIASWAALRAAAMAEGAASVSQATAG
jgi:uncharacterized membrane protein YbhN (UPF0104 family)